MKTTLPELDAMPARNAGGIKSGEIAMDQVTLALESIFVYIQYFNVFFSRTLSKL